MIADKPKPVIEDVVIPADKKEALITILNSSISRQNKRDAQKRLAGGECSCCDAIPTKILKYRDPDGVVLERYCDKHFPKWLAEK